MENFDNVCLISDKDIDGETIIFPGEKDRVCFFILPDSNRYFLRALYTTQDLTEPRTYEISEKVFDIYREQYLEKYKEDVPIIAVTDFEQISLLLTSIDAKYYADKTPLKDVLKIKESDLD